MFCPVLPSLAGGISDAVSEVSGGEPGGVTVPTRGAVRDVRRGGRVPHLPSQQAPLSPVVTFQGHFVLIISYRTFKLYTCVHIYVCVHIYMYVYIYICIDVCVGACLCMCRYAHTCTYTHQTKISCRALFNILHPVSKLPLTRAPLILTRGTLRAVFNTDQRAICKESTFLLFSI